MIETLKTEKKRRKRGKRLNLIGEEDFGAQLFHVSRVHAALAFEAEKEAKQAAERAEIFEKKAQAALNKQRKEEEARERVMRCQTKKDMRAQKAAEK